MVPWEGSILKYYTVYSLKVPTTYIPRVVHTRFVRNTVLVTLVGEAWTRVRVGDGYGSDRETHQAHPLDAQKQADLPRGGRERHPTTRTYIHPSLYLSLSLSVRWWRTSSNNSYVHSSFPLSVLLSIREVVENVIQQLVRTFILPSICPSLYPRGGPATHTYIHPSLYLSFSLSARWSRTSSNNSYVHSSFPLSVLLSIREVVQQLVRTFILPSICPSLYP